jgi:hypothetical protein
MVVSNESWIDGKDDAADLAFASVRASRPVNVAAQQAFDAACQECDRDDYDDYLDAKYDADFEAWLAAQKKGAA